MLVGAIILWIYSKDYVEDCFCKVLYDGKTCKKVEKEEKKKEEEEKKKEDEDPLTGEGRGSRGSRGSRRRSNGATIYGDDEDENHGGGTVKSNGGA
jgi:hypothetical protein